jgi:adenosylcobinamide-phosphate synthase
MMPVDLVAACALDAALGDPSEFPHPVRWMGRVIGYLHRRIRAMCKRPSSLRGAGVLLALGLPATAFAAGWALIEGGTWIHEWVGRGIGIALAATTLAWRDLTDHARAVSGALRAGSLERARQAVGMIVGRDTQQLSETEVVRAAVETIAESACDGIIAPLMFLLAGGPPLALAYKAISTLDSMVGHRDEEYLDVGWASARLDDLANWLPARLTACLIAAAGGLVSFSAGAFVRSAVIFLRDGHKHPSPNSGRPEAAMAGALGVQLGGVNFYRGRPSTRPLLGNAESPLTVRHVSRAVQIMTLAYVLSLIGAVRWLWR